PSPLPCPALFRSLAMVMPPATESVMGSLPPAKAGVGSAVNDTTRQVGAALGVAVLGSVMSSTYRPRVSDAISGFPVPDEVADAVTDHVGAAMAAAGQVGGEPGRILSAAATSGFADGMGVAFLVGAAALLLGAVIVGLYLPARAHDHDGAAATTPDAGGIAVGDGPAAGDTVPEGDGAVVDGGVTLGHGARLDGVTADAGAPADDGAAAGAGLAADRKSTAGTSRPLDRDGHDRPLSATTPSDGTPEAVTADGEER